MYSRIVVEDGEVGAAEEWMAASVVGSAGEISVCRLGARKRDGMDRCGRPGGDQRQRRRRRIECLLAVKLRVVLWLLCKLPCLSCVGIWGRTRHLGGAMERQNGEFAWVRVQ